MDKAYFSFINDSIIDKIVEKDQDLVYNNKVHKKSKRKNVKKVEKKTG